MYRLVRTTLLVAAAAAAVQPSAQEPDHATRLVEMSDTFRGNWPAFVARVTIEDYGGATLIRSEDFEVVVKGDKSLVRFLSPQSKGQSLLMRGEDLWFYLPAVARPVRITPVQRLLGNTANGDLARLRYADDYSAVLATDAISDPSIVGLDLRARRRSATYQHIRYRVRRHDGMPIEADFHLASGRLIKQAAFEAPRLFHGRTVISRIVITDPTNPASRTVMRFLDFQPQVIDDKVFNLARE
jgi:outer membrane lipoprotein-sorting protein